MGRNEIVEAGLSLMKSSGLRGLTTRKLGEILNVQGPALYHHYRSKEDLLGAMANAIVDSVIEDTGQDVDWLEWNTRFALGVRKAVLGYPDGALLLIKAWPTDTMRHHTIPRLEQPMLKAGFALHDAHEISFLLASFTIGWILYEQNPQINEFITERMNPDKAFERALATVLAGAKLRLGDRAGSP